MFTNDSEEQTLALLVAALGKHRMSKYESVTRELDRLRDKPVDALTPEDHETMLVCIRILKVIEDHNAAH